MNFARILVGAVAITIVFGVSVAGSAAAHEFVASKTGTISGKHLNAQKFKTNAGVFECKKQTTEGSVAGGSKKEAIVIKVQFLECAYFGFGMEASVAEFELNAEGTATIKKLVTLEVPLAGCEITYPTTGNSNLKAVTYKNLALGKLEIKSLLEKMSYGATGGSCGEPGANGAFSGNSEVELVGGTIEWK